MAVEAELDSRRERERDTRAYGAGAAAQLSSLSFLLGNSRKQAPVTAFAVKFQDPSRASGQYQYHLLFPFPPSMVYFSTPLSPSAGDPPQCGPSHTTPSPTSPNWHRSTQSYHDPIADQLAPATSRDPIQGLANINLSLGTSYEHVVRLLPYSAPGQSEHAVLYRPEHRFNQVCPLADGVVQLRSQ